MKIRENELRRRPLCSWRMRVSLLLLFIPALLLLVTAWQMLRLATHEAAEGIAGQGGVIFVYAHFIRETGVSRILAAAIVILLVAIPFRQRHRWAWVVLCAIFLLYWIPVVQFPVGFGAGAGIFAFGARAVLESMSTYPYETVATVCFAVGLILAYDLLLRREN